MAFNVTARLILSPPTLRNVSGVKNYVNRQLKGLSQPLANSTNARATAAINRQVTALGSLGKRASLAAKPMRLLGVAMNTIGSGPAVAGIAAVITVIGGITAAASAAYDSSVKLYDGLIDIKTIAKASDSELASLKETVLGLGSAFGVNTKDTLSAAGELVKAGLTIQEAQLALSSGLAQLSLDPSLQGGIGELIEGFKVVRGQFGTDIQETTRILEQFSGVAASSPESFTDILEATKRAGSVFATFNSDATNLAATFTALKEATQESAPSLGIALRTIGQKLQTDNAQEIVSGLGGTLRDDEGKLLPLDKQLRNLFDTLATLEPESAKFARTVQDLFQIRQSPRFLALFKNSAAISEKLAVALDQQGRAADVASVQNEKLSVSAERISAKFDTLVSVIGTDLAAAFGISTTPAKAWLDIQEFILDTALNLEVAFREMAITISDAFNNNALVEFSRSLVDILDQLDEMNRKNGGKGTKGGGLGIAAKVGFSAFAGAAPIPGANLLAGKAYDYAIDTFSGASDDFALAAKTTRKTREMELKKAAALNAQENRQKVGQAFLSVSAEQNLQDVNPLFNTLSQGLQEAAEKSLVGNLGPVEKLPQITERLRTLRSEPELFAAQLEKELEPFPGIVRENVKSWEELSRLGKDVSKYSALLQKKLDEFSKSVEDRAAIIGKRRDAFSELISIQTKRAEAKGGVNASFTDQTVRALAGGGDVSITGLGKRLRDSQDRLTRLDEQLKTADFTQRQYLIDEMGREREQIEGTTKALEFLASDTYDLSRAQDKLAKATAGREQIKSLASNFVFSDSAGQREIGKSLISSVVASQKGLAAIPASQRGQVSSFLDSIGDAKLSIFGGKTGSEVKDAILSQELSSLGLNQADIKAILEQSPEEEKLITAIDQQFGRMESAQTQLISSLKEINVTLIDGLDVTLQKIPALMAEGIKSVSTNVTQNTDSVVASELSSSLPVALSDFAEMTKPLVSALNNFPREVTHSGNHKVEVIINGQEAFATLEPKMRDLIISQIEVNMNKLITDKIPAAGANFRATDASKVNPS